MILPTVRIKPEVKQHDGVTEYHWHCHRCGYWGAIAFDDGQQTAEYSVLDDGIQGMIDTGDLHRHRCAKAGEDIDTSELPTLWLNVDELLGE